MDQINYRTIREAIRFSEDYGYNRWSDAQDELNRLIIELDELRQGVQTVVAVADRMAEERDTSRESLARREKEWAKQNNKRNQTIRAQKKEITELKGSRTIAIRLLDEARAERKVTVRRMAEEYVRVMHERDAAREAYALKAEMWSIAVADLGAAREALKEARSVALSFKDATNVSDTVYAMFAHIDGICNRALASPPERPSRCPMCGELVPGLLMHDGESAVCTDPWHTKGTNEPDGYNVAYEQGD